MGEKMKKGIAIFVVIAVMVMMMMSCMAFAGRDGGDALDLIIGPEGKLNSSFKPSHLMLSVPASRA
ncbi:uncharacterized protein G2W53_011567 [Senna tora]|uniref:Uncharacterized protein n=1 Tax=Senna tora TaxID=362788 RepID=A0A834X1I5_9FABA|nr:uncharacterized protein G2W53_011567 [Senna tora]